MTKLTLLVLLLVISFSPLSAQNKTVSQRETVRVDSLKAGSSLAVNLEGDGIAIGQWESFSGSNAEVNSSLSDLTHFTNLDTSGTSGHATTVAKIMGSKGATNASEIGVVPNATFYVFDVDFPYSNMIAELADAIDEYDLLLSNHSYDDNAGWQLDTFWFGVNNISETEDYKFGYYGYLARKYDSIMYAHPHHLIVKSVFNDRGVVGPGGSFSSYTKNGSSWDLVTRSSPYPEADGGADGYDGLSPDATSKNALVVGAVSNISGGYSSYTDIDYSSSQSQWGPTDDGRIKPDVVSPGDLSGGTAYSSFSTPVVTGIAAMLQEYYHDLYGRYMLASSVKALVIHTADAATANGSPNASSGYGLVNAHSAGVFLKNSDDRQQLIEGELANGETHEYSVYLDGTTDFRATLAWTDPAGITPTLEYDSTDLDDTTHILVNDLDMKLWNTSGPSMVGAAWKLDVSSPGSAATQGNNSVDNVERVDVSSASLSAGWYTVRVSHKGTLASPQQYSLLISDAGGVTFEAGSWSAVPNTWRSGVLVTVKDTSTIALVSADVSVGQLRVVPNGKLRIAEGNTLSVMSQVHLEADASGMAIMKGKVSGDVRVHFYIEGTAGFRYFGVPVRASGADWEADMNRVHFNGHLSPSIYGWNAATASWVALSESDSLHEHGGVVSYMGTNNHGQFSPLPLSKYITGELMPRTQSYTLTVDSDTDPSNSDEGWNLVSNFTTAPLDGQSIDWSGTDGTYYTWDSNLGDYASSNGVSHTKGGGRYIPRGQSFWLYCPSGSTGLLTIDSSDAVLTANPDVYKMNYFVRIKWYLSSGSYDEVFLRWDGNSSRSFRFGEDMLRKPLNDASRPECRWRIEDMDCVMGVFPWSATDSCQLLWNAGIAGIDSVGITAELPRGMSVKWSKNGMDYPLYQSNVLLNGNGAVYLKWDASRVSVHQNQIHRGAFEVTGRKVRWNGEKPMRASFYDLSGKLLLDKLWMPGEEQMMEFQAGVYTLVDQRGDVLKCSFGTRE
ncbi:MAG: hypothetical protein EP346_13805 [Bacteroidetes bacterium]|nr:MAG: hypothetical protein EP346_13805 [Bacteroidota bacterium]